MKTITRQRNTSLLSSALVACLFGLSTPVKSGDFPTAGRSYFNASLGGTWIESTTLTSSDLSLQSGQVKFTPGG